MTFGIVVKSNGRYTDLTDKISWCYERNIFFSDYNWIVEDTGMVESVEFTFKNPADASLFALRWS